MRISRRARGLLGLATALVSVACLAGCAAEDSCLRFSDCPSGLTCAESRCVKAGQGEGAPVSAAGQETNGSAASNARPSAMDASASADGGPAHESDAASSATDASSDAGAVMDASDAGDIAPDQ